MNRHHAMTTRSIATVLIALLLAGCTLPGTDEEDHCHGHDDAVYHDGPPPTDAGASPCPEYAGMGFDGTDWPDLAGHTVRVLDHGAFDYAFEAAKPLFENLTGARVEHVAADDAGTALQLAIQDHNAGGGAYDVIYGLDNVLLPRAVDAGILVPYTPVLAERVAEPYRFIPTQDGAWVATPVDHGYIAVNVDPRAGVPAHTLEDLAHHADKFVTQDPRFSSPGLGFLVSTVAVYGEEGYLDYWQRLFDGGVTVTSGWTEAYEDRFSGGYGQTMEGTRGDKPIVVSYTTSPAYEMKGGAEVLNDVLIEPGAVFRQIQTMAILEGADMAAAQAWIEFTLTDDFQGLAAEYNAIYPIVEDPEVREATEQVYRGHAPPPEALPVAPFTTRELAEKADGWVAAWTALWEEHQA